MIQLAAFYQDRENKRLFGEDAPQVGHGVCYSWVVKWLQTVQLLPGTSSEDSTRRLAVLRASYYDIRKLDQVATESKEQIKVNNAFEKDVAVFNWVAKKMKFVVIPTKADAASHRYIEIPEKPDANEKFDNFLTKLFQPGAKAINYTTHSSRHETAGLGFGN